MVVMSYALYMEIILSTRNPSKALQIQTLFSDSEIIIGIAFRKVREFLETI